MLGYYFAIYVPLLDHNQLLLEIIFCQMLNSSINSFTAKSVLAGTKNSHFEGFWLAKHKHKNIPTMMEPFSPPAAWFC